MSSFELKPVPFIPGRFTVRRRRTGGTGPCQRRRSTAFRTRRLGTALVTPGGCDRDPSFAVIAEFVARVHRGPGPPLTRPYSSSLSSATCRKTLGSRPDRSPGHPGDHPHHRWQRRLVKDSSAGSPGCSASTSSTSSPSRSQRTHSSSTPDSAGTQGAEWPCGEPSPSDVAHCRVMRG